MGEEVDAALMKKVKQTQDVLGSFIRRPPLTEKHLMKPPFRFLHDIVISVIENTGFLNGLYEGSELDASTITTRETKTAFMQKLIEALKLTTGENVDVKISKILAGQEPGKTNELLICLGNALAKNLNSDKAVQAINGKDVSSTNKPKPSTDTNKKKNAAAKLKESSPYNTMSNKKTTKPPVKTGKDEGAKGAAGKSKPPETPTGNKAGAKQSKPAVSTSPPKGAGPKPQVRQGSSDRLLAQKPATNKQGGSSEKPAPSSNKPSTSNSSLDKKGSARPSGSLDEIGPPSLGEGDAGNDEIVGHPVVAGGSRRGSVSTNAESASKYGRQQQQQQQQRNTGGEESTSASATSRPLGAFASPEAHADDDEQAHYMGEIDFLLKKHGYDGDRGHDEEEDETIGHQLDDDGHRSRHDDVHDDDDDDSNANDVEGKEKTESHNNNIPGSANKESLSRKSSNDPHAGAGKTEDTEVNGNSIHETPIDSISPPVLPPPTPMPLSKRNSAAHLRSSSKTPSHDLSPSVSALSITNDVLGPLSPSRMQSAKPLLPDINERPTTVRPPSARPHTSQMRPGGPQTIARPPSARPAPPRPKTALIPEKEEAAFRPTTAKVANVLLDAEEQADDENYIVHEVNPPTEPPSGDVDELTKSTELGLHGQLNVEENIDSILDPEQRGLLVNQMLDAQNKLGDGSRIAPNAKKTDIERDSVMGDKDRMRMREVTAAEVEKLKNLMQLMARNANPLGKLMDFVQEDVDAMQRDLIKWREESRKLDNSLEAAQEETEKSLEPLRRKMAELDENIQDRQDAIAATKMTIFRQEERIRKVLLGLDRVKPRTGKEPIITSADLNFGNFDFNNDNNKTYFKKAPSLNSSSPVP